MWFAAPDIPDPDVTATPGPVVRTYPTWHDELLAWLPVDGRGKRHSEACIQFGAGVAKALRDLHRRGRVACKAAPDGPRYWRIGDAPPVEPRS